MPSWNCTYLHRVYSSVTLNASLFNASTVAAYIAQLMPYGTVAVYNV